MAFSPHRPEGKRDRASSLAVVPGGSADLAFRRAIYSAGEHGWGSSLPVGRSHLRQWKVTMEQQKQHAGPAVLVVDDEPWLRMALSDAFTDEGYDVSEAANAAEALAILQAQRDIGVVITDIQMPGSMDGLRLARYIRDAYPPIALIVASGAVVPQSSELPDDAIFLSKPINVPLLLERIAGIITAQRLSPGQGPK